MTVSLRGFLAIKDISRWKCRANSSVIFIATQQVHRIARINLSQNEIYSEESRERLHKHKTQMYSIVFGTEEV